MYSFSKNSTCELIIKEYRNTRALNIILKDCQHYWGHTSSNHKEELLEEHLKLVEKYLLLIIEKHGIEPIINNLIDNYLKEIGFEDEHLFFFIKKIFVYTICYHDHGKINYQFQASEIKMNNPFFLSKKDAFHNSLGTDHSKLSAYVFILHSIKEADSYFDGIYQDIAYMVIFILSISILRHHSHFIDNGFDSYLANVGRDFEGLCGYLDNFHDDFDYKEISDDIYDLQYLLNKTMQYKRYAKSFPLYQLLRLNFSLLTASDYLATNEYKNDDKTEDLGVLDKKRVDELFKKVSQNEWIDKDEKKKNFNKKTYDELNTLLLEQPTIISNDSLNLLRQQMATEAIKAVRKNLYEKLFYIEAPTGGGKTNISMLVALELLKANPELNKVYYVFPFTTLIDQTYKSIKQNLGLKTNEIVALHSNSSFNQADDDDNYGDDKKNYVNRLFMNYPFCLLSHVKFFDILKTNKKETNYLLHRLANSIVIIDELQSYNPQHWDKVMYFIRKYAEIYNIRFVIMSATLPKISKLKIENVPSNAFVDLIPEAKDRYFRNRNFAERVAFDFSLNRFKIELEELAQKVLTESKKYAKTDQGDVKPLNSVFTIIEFIYKRSATRFWQEIKKINNGFFDEVFVLSGTILYHRRRYIINYLKRKENRKKCVLLITTQVVEAGVDIDMDLGFKNASLLDSDEQLAGRINRNVNKQGCKLFLFNHDKPNVIYGKDLRYEQTKNIDSDVKERILKTKDFDFLYEKVFQFKDERNNNSDFRNLSWYTDFVDKLLFASVDKEFQLIEQQNLSCFIPIHVPIMIEGETLNTREEVFTKSDLAFLAKNSITPNEENKIKGEDIFDLYIAIILSKKSYLDKKIDLKQLQPMLSKFTFSLFATKRIDQKIIDFSEEEKSEYGYKYIHRWEEFYTVESGMDHEKFESNETQFL